MENQTKIGLIKEIRHLISSTALDDLTEDILGDLLEAIKQVIYPNQSKQYIFKFDGGTCYLSKLVPDKKLSVSIQITNKNDNYLSVETLNQIMDYYGVHGQPQITYSSGKNVEKEYNVLVDVYAGEVPDYCSSLPKFSSRMAEALNLKVEGRTLKEMAAAIGCSVGTIVDSLNRAYRLSEYYGFRQIWPEAVEMKYSEMEYKRARYKRGKTKTEEKHE